jgi:tRNA(Ile)-lysidine synthase
VYNENAHLSECLQPEDFAQKLSQRTQGTHLVCDAEKLGFALDSRPSLQGAMLWVDSAQPADVMCPFGMSGRSKKISDLLNEAHIPLEERPLIPIVRQAPEGKIVWVASIRSDERFRCTPRTTVMLELSFTPAK